MTESSFDATPFLEPYLREQVKRSITLMLDEHTYSPGESLQSSWVPIALRAFAETAKRLPVRDLLIVGTGHGLDALGALEIFDLRSLSVTDISENILRTARANILANLKAGADVDLYSHVGDVLSSVPCNRHYCLIYENLPNLPLPEGLRLEHGQNSSSFFRAESREVPEKFARHLLYLHHRCLEQARPLLQNGGGVLTCIGGRVPLDVVNELHRSLGYVPELLVYDLKLQSEADVVVPQYRDAEARTGLTFRYYAPEAMDIVAAAKRDGLQGAALEMAIRDDLARFAMTAHEAWDRCQRGERVAHSVLMVLGVLPEART